jgi:hypothetical protein
MLLDAVAMADGTTVRVAVPAGMPASFDGEAAVVGIPALLIVKLAVEVVDVLQWINIRIPGVLKAF